MKITKILEDKGGPIFHRVDFNTTLEDFLEKPRIFTTRVEAGHFIWADVYNDPDTYKWLLQWSRPVAKP